MLVRNRAWKHEYIRQHAGKKPDREIAKEIGMSRYAVAKARARMGGPMYVGNLMDPEHGRRSMSYAEIEANHQNLDGQCLLSSGFGDSYMDARMPQPTDAWPGSAAKIEVLRERLERKEVLFHPDDVGYRSCTHIEQWLSIVRESRVE